MKKPARWWIPDLIDLHIYGGTALIGVGGWMWNGWTGPVFAGSVILALGVMRSL